MELSNIAQENDISSNIASTETTMSNVGIKSDVESMSFGVSRWKGVSNDPWVILDRWLTQLRVLIWKNLLLLSRKKVIVIMCALVPCFIQYIWLSNKAAPSCYECIWH